MSDGGDFSRAKVNWAARSLKRIWHHRIALHQNALYGHQPVMLTCCAQNQRVRKMTGPLVCVVDDDESVRESLPGLIKAFGFTVAAFSSAEEFLESNCIPQAGCLILDITMPGMSGPELQSELKRRHLKIPMVFITAKRDETVRASLLERGAVECLFKPFSAVELRGALKVAFRI